MSKRNNSKGCLIIICGLPATGKTTVAMTLAEHLDIEYLGTDQQREEMGLLGMYDKDSKQTVYDHILNKARKILVTRHRLIIEGTFHKVERRLPFIQLTEELQARIIWIELSADDATIEQRMKRKRLYSEADYAVYQKIKSELDPYPNDRIAVFSNDQSLDETISKIKDMLPDECK